MNISVCPHLGDRHEHGHPVLRHHLSERLLATAEIILVFAAFGFLIIRGFGRRQEYLPTASSRS
jgi:hypothetical protein